jgi:nitrogen PTS system EIIA component
MKVADFLSPADVVADFAAADKPKLLEALARRAGAAVDILPARLLAELQKREQLGSTGMGGGVAIPHARFRQVTKPIAVVLRLKRPIDFEAVDGNAVDTVVLMLLPDTANGDRLGALACMARKLRDPKTMAALRGAHDGSEIYRVLTDD